MCCYRKRDTFAHTYSVCTVCNLVCWCEIQGMWQSSDFLEHTAGLRGTPACETHIHTHTRHGSGVSESVCESHSGYAASWFYNSRQHGTVFNIPQTVLYDSVAHMHIYSHMCILHVYRHSVTSTNIFSVAEYSLVNKIDDLFDTDK